MMCPRTESAILSFMYKPLCIILLVLSLFGLIWLRSQVVTATYEIRTLEENKMDSLKDMKLLLAERAELMSLENIEASFLENDRGESVFARSGYVFPDRIKVIHIKRGKRSEQYRASLELRTQN